MSHADGFELCAGWRAKPAQRTVSDSMWQSGAAITLLDLGKYRVTKYRDGVLVLDQQEQLLNRLDTLFGPHSTTSPENTKARSVNESILGSQASAFHTCLTGLGVRHRYRNRR
ncbi:hypothetical protein [Nonomuraea sp. KM88]|uniref:hypothetical protein n=1 Tax=Nonomuraea sp. KM88 TaxID=3457427 RepID=UPI003FCCE5CC